MNPGPFREVFDSAERIFLRTLHPRSKLKGIRERCWVNWNSKVETWKRMLRFDVDSLFLLEHGVLLSQERFLPHFPNRLEPMFWNMSSEKCLVNQLLAITFRRSL